MSTLAPDLKWAKLAEHTNKHTKVTFPRALPNSICQLPASKFLRMIISQNRLSSWLALRSFGMGPRRALPAGGHRSHLRAARQMRPIGKQSPCWQPACRPRSIWRPTRTNTQRARSGRAASAKSPRPAISTVPRGRSSARETKAEAGANNPGRSRRPARPRQVPSDRNRKSLCPQSSN